MFGYYAQLGNNIQKAGYRMASGKVKTAAAQKAKVNFIKVLVASVIIICVAGFFVYISGLLPKLVTGVKVVENAADGTQTTVANISVLETNYHFNEVFSMYAMYGMVDRDSLDEVIDSASEEQQTYREFIYRTAADELMNSALVRRAAEADGYQVHSGAARYAQFQLDATTSSAEAYGYKSINQYLQAMYGTGFNANDFRTFSANEALTNEYENYVRQFKFVPSEEDIQATYDEDPTEFVRADFNYYLFSAEMDEDGNIINLDDTVSKAQSVVNAVNRGTSFKDAVKTILMRDADANADLIASFSDDSVDPTLMTGYSKSTAEYQFKTEVSDMIFSEDTEIGKAFLVELDNGTYVISVAARTTDETPTVTYRTLTIANPASSETDATEADIEAGFAQIQSQAQALIANRMDAISFADCVKQNTTVSSEILNGGYVSGDTPANYEPSEDEEISQKNAEIGAWLFDEARTAGDTMIIPAADKSNVVIYYFENVCPAWMATVKDKYITARVNGWSQELQAGSPSVVINYGWLKSLQY